MEQCNEDLCATRTETTVVLLYYLRTRDKKCIICMDVVLKNVVFFLLSPIFMHAQEVVFTFASEHFYFHNFVRI